MSDTCCEITSHFLHKMRYYGYSQGPVQNCVLRLSTQTIA